MLSIVLASYNVSADDLTVAANDNITATKTSDSAPSSVVGFQPYVAFRSSVSSLNIDLDFDDYDDSVVFFSGAVGFSYHGQSLGGRIEAEFTKYGTLENNFNYAIRKTEFDVNTLHFNGYFDLYPTDYINLFLKGGIGVGFADLDIYDMYGNKYSDDGSSTVAEIGLGAAFRPSKNFGIELGFSYVQPFYQEEDNNAPEITVSGVKYTAVYRLPLLI